MGDNEYKKDAEFKADAVDGDGDGMVQDGTIHERPVEEVVVEEKVEEPAPAAAPAPKKVKNSASSSSAPKTRLTSDTVVRMSAIDFDSLSRNSASVAAVQVRLIEHGYYDAGSDKRGDIGEGTCKALCEFQKDKGIDGECNSAPVIEALFDRTTIKVLP